MSQQKKLIHLFLKMHFSTLQKYNKLEGQGLGETAKELNRNKLITENDTQRNKPK